MPDKTAVPASEQLQQLKRRLDEWRVTRAPRAHIPEELWAAAVEVAGGQRSRQHRQSSNANVQSKHGFLSQQRKTPPARRRTLSFSFFLGESGPRGAKKITA